MKLTMFVTDLSTNIDLFHRAARGKSSVLPKERLSARSAEGENDLMGFSAPVRERKATESDESQSG